MLFFKILVNHYIAFDNLFIMGDYFANSVSWKILKPFRKEIFQLFIFSYVMNRIQLVIWSHF